MVKFSWVGGSADGPPTSSCPGRSSDRGTSPTTSRSSPSRSSSWRSSPSCVTLFGRGTSGRKLQAVRGSELAAQSIGISPARHPCHRLRRVRRSSPASAERWSACTRRAVGYGKNFTPFGALFWLVLVVTFGARSPTGAIIAAARVRAVGQGLPAGHVPRRGSCAIAEPHPRHLPDLARSGASSCSASARSSTRSIRKACSSMTAQAAQRARDAPRARRHDRLGSTEEPRPARLATRTPSLRPTSRTDIEEPVVVTSILQHPRRPQELRRHRRARVGRHRRRAGRAGRAHRTERRRQDHVLQLHPRHAAHRRAARSSSTATTSPACASTSGPGSGSGGRSSASSCSPTRPCATTS